MRSFYPLLCSMPRSFVRSKSGLGTRRFYPPDFWWARTRCRLKKSAFFVFL